MSAIPIVAIAAVLGLAACGGDPDPAGTTPASSAATVTPTFVGSDSCAKCHAMEHEAWRGSHHDLAMQEATVATVVGDFEGATFDYAGVRSTFTARDGKYFVTTDGPDGALTEYEIAYTYGVEPLQQYLIEFPDGRIQALNVCWDTRPAEEGGQRWFHLYPDEAIDHRDPLHWTGPMQNWNFMCAECHSTNVRKNYRPDADRFETTWSEIDVSCEACHGPGSRHVAWAEGAHGSGSKGSEDESGGARRKARDAASSDLGLAVSFRDAGDGYWQMNAETGIARRTAPRSTDAELQTCARCHSRRAMFSEDHVPGGPLMNTHRPALLEEGLYHADGQILDEVYVYGSFLQSRMHAAGVTCGDCHEPHSLELRAPGNAACITCHAPATFDVPEHHRHEQGSAAAQCVACHMPSRNYMVVDPRRDHSFRVPRPDLTAAIGTPNACATCHADRSAEWAARALREWHGPERPSRLHYGEMLHAGREGHLGAGRLLAELAADPVVPGIVRATAVSLVPANADPETASVVQRAAVDGDPLVRLAAADAAPLFDSASRVELLAPLLADPLRAIRMEAALGLADVPRDALPANRRSALDDALREYREAQALNADRAEGHHNLGLLHQRLGERDRAAEEYRKATAKMPAFAAAWVNLADLERERGNEAAAESLLREGLAASPGSADLHHALGLALVRQKRYDDAIVSLRRAVSLAPRNSRYAYVLAVALDSTGRRDEGLRILGEAHERRPGDIQILAALVSINMDAGRRDRATEHARKLMLAAPDHPLARQVLGPQGN